MERVSLFEDERLGIHVVEHSRESMDEKEIYTVVLEEDGEEYGNFEAGRELEPEVKVERGQLALIYSLQLAEAIVAASLQPQLYMLLRETELCGGMNSAYWTGLVEAVFALGSIAGLFWGRVGDRRGRRPVALMGMLGLSISCIAMGFSDGILACMLIRAFAGLMSSSIRVALATMIGDVSTSSAAKVRNFSKLPLVATGGVIGPLLQAALAHRIDASGGFWMRFPILSSQMACASLMFVIFLANAVFLKETLPRVSSSDEERTFEYIPRRGSESSDEYGEKDAFLSQSIEASPAPTSDRLDPMKLSELVRAPSLMILLGSFSFLSLHSASFDQLLPLLGNSPTSHGGLGLPCSFISVVSMFGSISAGIVVATCFRKSVQRLGLLRLYRLCCWVFPAIYVATPLLSKLAEGSRAGIIISSTFSVFTKTLVSGFAQTLVVLLVTSASPDAFSLATIMGFMQCASVFRSLAVGGTALAYSLSDEVSIQATNYGLWSTIAAVSLAGAAVAYFVRDHPTVRDYSSSLKWEVCYDASMDETVLSEEKPEGVYAPEV